MFDKLEYVTVDSNELKVEHENIGNININDLLHIDI